MKVPVATAWQLPAVNGVRFSGPAPTLPPASGFTPQTGFSVSGSLTEGGSITISRTGGGFGAQGPTLLYYDDYTTVDAGGQSLPAGRFGIGYSTDGGTKLVHAVPGMPYGRGLAVGSTGSTQNAVSAGTLRIRPTGDQPYAEFYEFKVQHVPAQHVANMEPFLNSTNTWQVKGIWHYFEGDGFNAGVTTKNDLFIHSGFPGWYNPLLYWLNSNITGSNKIPVSNGTVNGRANSTLNTGPIRVGPSVSEAWIKPSPIGTQPANSDGMYRLTDTTEGLINARDFAGIGYFNGQDALQNTFDRCTITGFERGYLVNEQCNGYYGQVYIAIGPGCPARVMITDSADYGSSRLLSVCTVDSWSDSAIGATIRGGFFSDSGLVGRHIHVFDANNDGWYVGGIV